MENRTFSRSAEESQAHRMLALSVAWCPRFSVSLRTGWSRDTERHTRQAASQL